MLSKKISLGIFLFTFLLSNCSAKPQNSVNLTSLTVETPNCSQAKCRVKDNSGVYYVDTPGTIPVRTSNEGFDIVCFAEGEPPENLIVSSFVNFVSHPFSCPDTEEEKKQKAEYLETINNEKRENEENVPCLDCKTEINKEALKEQTLSEEDLILLQQLEELFEQGLISEVVYEKEKQLINNKDQK